MKEATGELNMTVVTVVAIAAVGAFFYLAIWPRIKSSITKSTDCAQAVCQSCTTDAAGNRTCNQCKNSDGDDIGTCVYKDSNKSAQD